jgi:hypothetical protein
MNDIVREAFEAGFRAGFDSGADANQRDAVMAACLDDYRAMQQPVDSTHALLEKLDARVTALEQGTGVIRLGPDVRISGEEIKDAYERQRVVDAIDPPVDRTQVTTTSGEPADLVRNRQVAQGTDGQYDSYIVLNEQERAKGFVRPLRRSYKHLKCGGFTGMKRELMETYARDPGFYQYTFCMQCNGHYPVTELVWELDGKKVGS